MFLRQRCEEQSPDGVAGAGGATVAARWSRLGLKRRVAL